MKTHRLFSTGFSECERRLIAKGLEFSGGEKELLKKRAEEEKHAGEESLDDEVDTLARETNATISKYKENTKHLPDVFVDQFNSGIGEFYRTSLEAFDTMADGLDGEEFQEYQKQMLSNIDAMLEKYKHADDAAKEEVQNKAQEAEEKEIGSVDEEIADFENLSLGDEDLTLDSNLFTLLNDVEKIKPLLSNEDGLPNELRRYDKRAKRIGTFTEQIGKQYGELEDLQKAFSNGSSDGAANVAVASTCVVAGATLGTAVPFVGNAVGAVGGAIVGGAFLAGVYLAKYAGGSGARKKLKQKVDKAAKEQRQRIDEAVAKVKSEATEMKREGAMLNNAPEQIRSAAILAEQDRQASVQQQRESTDENLTLAELEAQATTEAIAELNKQKTEIDKGKKKIAEQRDKLRAGKDAAAIKNRDLVDNSKKVSNTILTIDAALDSVPDPQKQALLQKKQALEQAQGGIVDGIASTAGMDTTAGVAIEDLKNNALNLDATDASIDDHILMMDDAVAYILDSMNVLAAHKTTLDNVDTEAGQKYLDHIVEINGLDQDIGSGVLNLQLSNSMNIATCDRYTESAAKMKLEGPSLAQATWGKVFEGFGHGAKFVFDTVIGGTLRKVGDGLAYIPVVGGFLEQVSDVPAGVAAGLGGMLEGVSGMVAHPDQFWAGIKSMVTSAETREQFVKFMFATETFGEGKYGEGFGMVIANVGSMLTPTAPMQGLRAGQTAFIAARAAGMRIPAAAVHGAAATGFCTTKALGVGIIKKPIDAAKATGKGVRKLVTKPKEVGAACVKFAKDPIQGIRKIRIDRNTAKLDDINAQLQEAANARGMPVDDLCTALKENPGQFFSKDYKTIRAAKEVKEIGKLRELAAQRGPTTKCLDSLRTKRQARADKIMLNKAKKNKVATEVLEAKKGLMECKKAINDSRKSLQANVKNPYGPNATARGPIVDWVKGASREVPIKRVRNKIAELEKKISSAEDAGRTVTKGDRATLANQKKHLRHLKKIEANSDAMIGHRQVIAERCCRYKTGQVVEFGNPPQRMVFNRIDTSGRMVFKIGAKETRMLPDSLLPPKGPTKLARAKSALKTNPLKSKSARRADELTKGIADDAQHLEGLRGQLKDVLPDNGYPELQKLARGDDFISSQATRELQQLRSSSPAVGRQASKIARNIRLRESAIGARNQAYVRECCNMRPGRTATYNGETITWQGSITPDGRMQFVTSSGKNVNVPMQRARQLVEQAEKAAKGPSLRKQVLGSAKNRLPTPRKARAKLLERKFGNTRRDLVQKRAELQELADGIQPGSELDKFIKGQPFDDTAVPIEALQLKKPLVAQSLIDEISSLRNTIKTTAQTYRTKCCRINAGDKITINGDELTFQGSTNTQGQMLFRSGSKDVRIPMEDVYKATQLAT